MNSISTSTTERSVTHSTFSLERTFDASPARVWHALTDPTAKAQWFGGKPEDGWVDQQHTLDFRLGGSEHASGKHPEGPHFTYDAVFQDIVPNERLVTTYAMTLNGERISVSVASYELRPSGAGTTLVLTEAGAYLDGFDDSSLRERGTAELMDALGAYLASGE